MVAQMAHGGVHANGSAKAIMGDPEFDDIMVLLHAGPAPAIPRLGIPPYQWSTECLSGDSGMPSTSFPMSIGMVTAIIL